MYVNSKFFEVKGKELWLKPEGVQSKDGRFLVFDLDWKEMPKAKSYALTLVDYEASRVIGQPFVHFAAANITSTHLKHGENLEKTQWVMGVNSRVPGAGKNSNGVHVECIPAAFKASSFEEACDYFPPMPPDKKHLYTLKVYGLDTDKLDLEKGFFLGDLNRAMLDHVVDVYTVNFWYKQ
ncbi:YbhB/YbcL family Raf kinase inhibitor-like protein [Mycoplasmopsis synoviae]|uniref:YbhB/YbcL family Raf kinase inhibitor-like protein n=1 Tax=Mycoplasmopsis synoviae TaxID=2109 RepID=UPI001CE1BED3|nr:YbhB/YbcL family Raf kinase inhibitor-like protein [Mycoplasmopsis synoviae]UBX98529.1 YbhB/YbcL family Raf kinase inhibitor-like protein [Mycoplasmopsis synoviae]